MKRSKLSLKKKNTSKEDKLAVEVEALAPTENLVINPAEEPIQEAEQDNGEKKGGKKNKNKKSDDIDPVTV
jgi:hypothetical protein